MPSHDVTRQADARRDIVLVVDDSPETLSFLTTALRQDGITVLVALDSDGAMAVIDKIMPDLILLDAIMPGQDGFEVCRQLKRLPEAAHIPVIFMTGLTETEHILKGFEAGGVDYVTKPIVVDELMARMRVHLMNARLAHSARMALDTTGRYLLSVDGRGVIRWSTPQARRLLAGLLEMREGEEVAALPRKILTWLRHPREQPGLAGNNFVLELDGRHIELVFLDKIGGEEYLLRLIEAETTGDEVLLQQSLALTQREAEVLLWTTRGKSNRNISEILNISPRTVDKHLEQVYAKLGVENRVAAAAIALRALQTGH